MPGDNGRCFISFAHWLRPKIYRSLGRVKTNHHKHGRPLPAGVSLPWEAIVGLEEDPGDPGGLGPDALAGKRKGSAGMCGRHRTFVTRLEYFLTLLSLVQIFAQGVISSVSKWGKIMGWLESAPLIYTCVRARHNPAPAAAIIS